MNKVAPSVARVRALAPIANITTGIVHVVVGVFHIAVLLEPFIVIVGLVSYFDFG
jgi:hypothetical protein